jgi:hypothetical protein
LGLILIEALQKIFGASKLYPGVACFSCMRNKTANTIYIVTGMLLVYVIAASLPISFGIIFLFFLLTTAGLLWVVYTVLTDTSNLSGKTFDEHFYEDVD